MTFVPSFVLVSQLGWVDSLRGLIIPGLFSGFTCFLFRQYFLESPRKWRRRRAWTGSATGRVLAHRRAQQFLFLQRWLVQGIAQRHQGLI